MTDTTRIVSAEVITVALSNVGVRLHSDGNAPSEEIRHIVRLTSQDGIVGLGEAGSRIASVQLAEAANRLIGADPFQLDEVRRQVMSAKFYRMELAIGAAALQTACLDIVGRSVGRPISALLGGRLRDRVPVIGYLYRRALDGGGLLDQAKAMHERHGFRTWKLKAGAMEVRADIDMVRTLREAFPEHRIRVDPNAGWDIATALGACRALEDCGLEWIEDPVLGIEAMATLTRRVSMPTATNMCCIEPTQFPLATRRHAMDVMLLDLWYLGGPWSAYQMASMCGAFGIGIGVHAGGGSPEAGVGFAAELHLASALPSLVHAADTAYFELAEDVVDGEPFTCQTGEVHVPSGPGLGITLDEDAVGRAAARFRKHAVLGKGPFHPYPAYPLY